MKIKSREITYRSVIEQIFFEDESELIIKIGWPEGQESDLDFNFNWVNGKPKWAESINEMTFIKGEDNE